MSIDEGLGTRLQLEQGTQWLHAAQGDPFAALQRGFDENVQALEERVRRRGELWAAHDGTWVTGRHRVAGQFLGHRLLDRHDGDFSSTGDIPVPGGPAPDGGAVDPAALTSGWERALDQAGTEFDLMDVAERPTFAALGELLAVPAAELPTLTGMCADAAIAADSVLCPQRCEQVGRLRTTLPRLRERCAGRPGGVALAALGARFAVDLVGKSVLALTAHPREWAKLTADPARAELVVDETLRWSPPVQVQPKVAKADLVLGGRRVAEGSRVAAVLSAANRDPAVFAEPDRFAPDRSAAGRRDTLLPDGPYAPALAFARSNAEAALCVLATRVPGLHRAGPFVPRPRAPVTRGIARLPMTTT